MNRIADLVKKTRDETFHEWWETPDASGKPVKRR
jgi:hypothetical protein